MLQLHLDISLKSFGIQPDNYVIYIYHAYSDIASFSSQRGGEEKWPGLPTLLTHVHYSLKNLAICVFMLANLPFNS